MNGAKFKNFQGPLGIKGITLSPDVPTPAAGITQVSALRRDSPPSTHHVTRNLQLLTGAAGPLRGPASLRNAVRPSAKLVPHIGPCCPLPQPFPGLSSPFLLFFFVHCAACKILVLQPGIKPASPAVEAWSLNHWTTGKSHSYPLFCRARESEARSPPHNYLLQRPPLGVYFLG